MMDNSLLYITTKKYIYGKCFEQNGCWLFQHQTSTNPSAQLTFFLPELVSEPPEVHQRPDESQILTEIHEIRRSFSIICIFHHHSILKYTIYKKHCYL